MGRVRIIHGKGIGQLREIVHRELRKNAMVASFQLAGSAMGGWGATIVDLIAGVGERIEGNQNHG
jgi:dsDNA-specific endonuclease/ATPase MutS2